MVERCAVAGYATRRLHCAHAFHSAHMDAIVAELTRVATGLAFHPPEIAIVSGLTGRELSTDEVCSPRYWARHARKTVRFGDGVRWLSEQGTTTFVELGPDGAMCAMARQCLPDQDASVLVPAQRTGHAEASALLAAVAELHVHGLTPRWPCTCSRVRWPPHQAGAARRVRVAAPCRR